MKLYAPLKRMGRVAVWLTYPLYGPFARGLSLMRTGLRMARDLPELTTDQKSISSDDLQKNLSQTRQARIKTRNYGVFCVLLLILFTLLWFYDVFWEKQSIMGPICIQLAALITMLAGQFLFLSFSNWTMRQGRPGSFSEFMSNGRNLWPR